ncbi:MAG TPA: 3-hydroxyacyl-CoA dehydrogenase NAD-binding domain-containing protein [Candidatus Acidoferrales bacterium]|jgi:3-hydroxyacyl-CoA dehydrogenase|nr:3-hydroxyacyl-CoA dehydrogenase NAD-binding domain-containing protein [Candidatus Acidoferrales bacterium]
MKRRIEKVAVLGAGTMGARIAAHLANAGIPCFLLDILPAELNADEKRKGLTLESSAVRNRIVLAGLEAAKKARPAAFFTPETARLVTPGNLEDNIAWCGQVDWIVEAVAENLEIKRNLFARVEAVRKLGTIVTSNTSGLPIHLIAQGRSEDFQLHWAGTHFFNPPRYMKLVELIAGPKTRPEVLESLDEICDLRLGKGVVVAKDTPNFIANRIGTFSMLNVLRRMQELEMTIEDVDACTGPAIGQPKSATFRTADLVGLDILAHVVRNIYENVTGDESREIYKLPPFVEEMLKRGWLGDKTAGGFYKKVKKGGDSEILTLDWQKMEYRPRQKAKFGSIEAGKAIEDTRERVRALVAPALEGKGGDKANRLLWSALSETCLYAARRVPEIADRILDVDRAMRWGFAWELGPFETWDAIGVERMGQALEREGKGLPPIVRKALESPARSFYQSEKGTTRYFDLAANALKPLEEPAGIIILKSLKDRTGVVQKNAGASLIDLGDGVICCEFHSKMNSIGGDLVAMIHAGISRLSSEFDAMVIGNQATNFSVGANLMLVLIGAQEGEWDDIHMAVRQFQRVNMAIKYAPRPVVAAPQGLALGGGCEIGLHAGRIHAAAEAYIGLVETGVGLIPGGGGTKEMLIRANEHSAGGENLDLFHALKPVFENIAMAKVSTSGEEARMLGYLRPSDLIAMNRDRQIADAKQTALAMVRAGYHPPAPAEIRVLGEEFLAAAKLAIHMMVRGGYATEYDGVVGRKLAYILAGGPITAPQTVSEQYVLDLEREAFVSLCGERKTQERMAHTLKTGKPLRN